MGAGAVRVIGRFRVPDSPPGTPGRCRHESRARPGARSQKLGHRTLPGAFVEARVVKGNGESIQPVVGEIAHDGGDDRGIESAAQVGSDWHVGPQPDFGGVDQEGAELLFVALPELCRSPPWAGSSEARERPAPNSPYASACRRGPPGNGPGAAPRCLEKWCAAKAGHQNVKTCSKTAGSISARTRARRQHGLDFRAEDKPAALLGVEERPDAEPVPR